MDKKNENPSEEIRHKHDANSSNDPANDMLQKEKIIDPGK